MSALTRLNMPEKYLGVVQSLYNQPKFMVELDGVASSWKTQETGIRQGCPLSPYLFILVMTVIFADIHDEDKLRNLCRHRLAGATFDEILYADDTICVSKDTRSMNKLLESIERIGENYGMKLNKTKCELLKFGGRADVHFKDGVKVPQMGEVKYLGVILNDKCDNRKELKSKISNCMATLNKLNLFWGRAHCPASFKLHVYDAVIRSKVIYGLESAELTEGDLKILDVFHLKGLRKIMKMKTTYVNRANTNERVYDRASAALNEHSTGDKGERIITPLRETYQTRKLRLLEQIISLPDKDPVKNITMDPKTLKPIDHGARRVGRPKSNWTENAMVDYWKHITKDKAEWEGTTLDLDREDIVNYIKTIATRNQRRPGLG